MGLNAFTSLGKTVKLTAASSPPEAVQVSSTTLGGNQYRVINISSNTACFLSYAQTKNAAEFNCNIPIVGSSQTVLPLLPQTDEILSFVPNAYFTAITIAGNCELYITPGDGL